MRVLSTKTGQVRTQVFTSAGTWVAPVRSVYIEMCGGGAGGQNVSTNVVGPTYGTGGGGAESAIGTILVVPGQTYTILIGAGGPASSGQNVSIGGTTVFFGADIEIATVGGGANINSYGFSSAGISGAVPSGSSSLVFPGTQLAVFNGSAGGASNGSNGNNVFAPQLRRPRVTPGSLTGGQGQAATSGGSSLFGTGGMGPQIFSQQGAVPGIMGTGYGAGGSGAAVSSDGSTMLVALAAPGTPGFVRLTWEE